MDVLAPVKTKIFSGKQKASWRNASTVAYLKKECRKAERRWRKTKLLIDCDIYKEKLRLYNLELCRTRQSYFSAIINGNINNTHSLFSTIDR
ncbi:hypothetical protein LDENG_00008850 [Lucifuga dentata]|nr:hypothetical protein LDENG_00008850 [Lucifuga dentata]